MIFNTVKEFARARPKLPGGVIAILLCESERHVGASARRLAAQGASAIVAVGTPNGLTDAGCAVFPIAETPHPKSLPEMMQSLLTALSGQWVVWLWNSEFLVFPYGETRTLSDLAAFLGDERRTAIHGYVLDLYSRRLPTLSEDPSRSAMYFDRIGYYAFPEKDRTLRLRGGLGWRFEEFTPPSLQPINRAVMLKPGTDLKVSRDLSFGHSDYDSLSCPWHHNPTAAIMSLRRSRRIMAHPGFPALAHKLIWQGSTRFNWTSGQLLDLGLIEPGQWF